MRNFSDNLKNKKRENNRDQDNMIDRLRFRAICSIRFELENSNFDFLFLLNPRYDAKSDRFCEFLKSIFIKKFEIYIRQKNPIFIKVKPLFFFYVVFEEMNFFFSFELFKIGNGSKYLEIAR